MGDSLLNLTAAHGWQLATAERKNESNGIWIHVLPTKIREHVQNFLMTSSWSTPMMERPRETSMQCVPSLNGCKNLALALAYLVSFKSCNALIPYQFSNNALHRSLTNQCRVHVRGVLSVINGELELSSTARYHAAQAQVIVNSSRRASELYSNCISGSWSKCLERKKEGV